MKFRTLLNKSETFTTNFMPLGLSALFDGFCEVAIVLYTFILRHQVLAVINIAVISVNLFFIWTFNKRKVSNPNPQSSPASEKSSTYNKYLKRLQAEAKKSGAGIVLSSRNKSVCRQPNIKLTSTPSAHCPDPEDPARPVSCKKNSSSCPSFEESRSSTSENVEETLDEITWGFDTSPLSSHPMTEIDNAGHCLLKVFPPNLSGPFTAKPYLPILKSRRFQPKVGVMRLIKVVGEKPRSQFPFSEPRSVTKNCNSQDSEEVFRIPTTNASPTKSSRTRVVTVRTAPDAHQSPVKGNTKQVAFKRCVAPASKGRNNLKANVVSKLKMKSDREASSDYDLDRNPLNVLPNRHHSESPETPGNRSETSVVCKRDSWIWFFPEEKQSDEDFLSRQQKFKSEDPRVAELAAEIKRQEELNKNIEKEAESLIESSSQSNKYHVNIAQATRSRGRCRVIRCIPYGRPSVNKSSSNLIGDKHFFQTFCDGLKKPSKSSSILFDLSPQKHPRKDLSPMGKTSESATLVYPDNGKRQASSTFVKCSVSSTENVSPFCAHLTAPKFGKMMNGHGKVTCSTPETNLNTPALGQRSLKSEDTVKTDNNVDCSLLTVTTLGDVRPVRGIDFGQSSPTDEDNLMMPSYNSPKTSSSLINLNTSQTDSQDKRHSASSLDLSSSKLKTSPCAGRDGRPAQANKQSSQLLLLSTGESESESLVKEKSGQETSFRQILIRKEVNTAVHQLLFDTELSSSSMSPSATNRLCTNMCLNRTFHEQVSPNFHFKHAPDEKSFVSLISGTYADKMKDPLPKRGTKRTDIYKPDYYLGKRARTKRLVKENMTPSPSRWKKTDPSWSNTISPRLYSPKPTLLHNLTTDKDHETAKTAKSKQTEVTNLEEKQKPKIAVFKNTSRKQLEVRNPRSSILKKTLTSSRSLQFKDCPSLRTRTISSVVLKNDSPAPLNKVSFNEIVKKSLGSKNEPIKQEILHLQLSHGDSPQTSPFLCPKFAGNTRDSQKILTYSDSYCANVIHPNRTKQSSSGSTVSCQMSPISAGGLGIADLKGSIVSTGAEDIKVSHLLPGSTNNSSSNDQYHHGSNASSSKIHLCDRSSQFYFVSGDVMNVTSRGDTVESALKNKTSINDPLKSLASKNATQLFKKVDESDHNTKYLPKNETSCKPNATTHDKCGKSAFSFRQNINQANYFQTEIKGRKEENRSTQTTSPLTCSGKNVPQTQKNKIYFINTVTAGCVVDESVLPSQVVLPATSSDEESYLIGHMRLQASCGPFAAETKQKVSINAALQPGSNPDSGYEESISEKPHTWQENCQRPIQCPGPVERLKLRFCDQGNDIIKASTLSTSISYHSRDSASFTVSNQNNFYKNFSARSLTNSGTLMNKSTKENILNTRNECSLSNQENNAITLPGPLYKTDNIFFGVNIFFKDKKGVELPTYINHLSATSKAKRNISKKYRDILEQFNMEHNIFTNLKDEMFNIKTSQDTSLKAEKKNIPTHQPTKSVSPETRLERMVHGYLVNPSLSSSLDHIDYSPMTSTSITRLLLANQAVLHSPTTENSLDCSLSTAEDIQLLESLGSTAPSVNSLTDDIDRTFDKSILSSGKSELNYSDSLVLQINNTEPAYRIESTAIDGRGKLKEKTRNQTDI